MQLVKLADRSVGRVVREKNAFFVHREEKHFFRIFNGFGLNKRVLLELKNKGVGEVWVFFHRPTQTELWVAKVCDWIEKGRSWTWEGNFGKRLHERIVSEEQLVLSEDFFRVV